MEFKKEIRRVLEEKISKEIQEDIVIEVPPNSEMGDYALPCFRFAKILKKSPNIIAEEIKEKFSENKWFDRVETMGGYVNFFVNREVMAKSVITEVQEKGNDYGKSNMGRGKNIVIDYSSPNIAKLFHIGHLRSTVIGNSLYNIYSHLGYNAIGINHLGDWGTQFGKMIYAYKEWGDDSKINADPINELQKLYVKFHDESEKNKEIEDEGKKWFKKLEEGDSEARRIWDWFVKLSLDEFNRIYELLDMKFDYYTGESFYEDKMADAIKLMEEKKVLGKSEGAIVVDLEKYDMPPCLIIKEDGSTIYATRDITAALYRMSEFNFEKAIYITDYAQNLHFKQWFKVIELMGYDWHNKLLHTPFGRVSTLEGKLQSRRGNIILLEELLNRSIEQTKKLISEKNPNLENKDEIAREVGIGAVIFNDLSNNKIKDIVFDWDRMLAFEGETGPYVQYTYARAKSILRKSDIDYNTDVDYKILTDDITIEVLKMINRFPEIVIEAMEKNEPSFVARYVIDLAQNFNKFYHECPILKEENKTKKARLLVVDSVAKVLKLGLSLLGIKSPERM